jgi:anti-sigma factor RsiW
MTRHDETERLLPWYANGTLAPGERAEVEAHLAGCPLCRDELAREQGLAAALRAAGEVAPSPHPAQLARLLARLDEPAPALAPPPRRLPARLRAVFAGTPRPVRWAMAAQLALLALLLASREWRPAPPAPAVNGAPAAVYHTLSDPAAPAAAARGPRLRVMFAEETSERELRALLRTVGGRIVDGPSPLGVYTVEVPAGPAADPVEAVLQHLRSNPRVRFAGLAAGSEMP